MTRKLPRANAAPHLEGLEARTLLTLDGWQGYALDPQHTAESPVASAALEQIRWQAPVDLDPQYSGSDLLIHYGSPLVTAANTVIVPVKTGATGGFEVQARSGSTGALRWTLTTDYALMPSGGSAGYDWTPTYSPTLTPGNRLYFAADGGTVLETDSPDAPGPTPPSTTRLAFYGTSNYNANPSAYNTTVFINTPITTDSNGDIFFGFLVTGSNPLGLTSGVARIGANGTGSYVGAVSGTDQVATNSAPALSNDGSTLYVLESTGNFGSGKLVSLNSQTLAVQAQDTLMDPHNTSKTAVVTNDASASPMVGPDGNVYIGVLENPFASNNDRGWLLQFSGDLSTEKTPAAFGWDDTPSVVPASMVPSYHGSSSYLLMTKYNNYADEGGDGINKLAILDPNAMMTDPITGTTVMQDVLTIVGPTPDAEFLASHPDAVREWCINSAVVDPATDSILANSEDGTTLPLEPRDQHHHAAGDPHQRRGRGLHPDPDRRRWNGVRDQQRNALRGQRRLGVVRRQRHDHPGHMAGHVWHLGLQRHRRSDRLPVLRVGRRLGTVELHVGVQHDRRARHCRRPTRAPPTASPPAGIAARASPSMSPSPMASLTRSACTRWTGIREQDPSGST